MLGGYDGLETPRINSSKVLCPETQRLVSLMRTQTVTMTLLRKPEGMSFKTGGRMLLDSARHARDRSSHLWLVSSVLNVLARFYVQSILMIASLLDHNTWHYGLRV
jgi:hypothetical protein